MEYRGDSIQYRIRRDIQGIPSQTEEMVNLHDRIMLKPKVKKILDAQLMELLESVDLYKKQNGKSLQRFREIWSIEDHWKKKEQIHSDLFFLALLDLHQVGLYKNDF